MKKDVLRPVSQLLLVSLLFSGCYSWSAIKPTELPKLNGASNSLNNTSGGTVRIITVAHLEAPDGRLVQIKGESDARISTGGALPISFTHPVRASVEGQDLIVQSANNPRTQIPLAQVKSVEVSQYDTVKSTLAMILLSSAGAALIILATTK